MRTAAVLATAMAFGRAYAFHEGGVAYCDGCHSMHNSQTGKSMSGGRNTGLTGWNALGKASTTQFQGNAYLLQGSDDSSTCLNCHAANDSAPNSYHIMTFPAPAAGAAPVERTPGGDFAWLKITTTATASYGAPVSNPGDRHGHNVVAQDYGLTADAVFTGGTGLSPGGSYPVASLSCASCHDPHSRARVDSTGTVLNQKLGAATAPIIGSGSYGTVPGSGEAVGVYRLLGSKTYSQMSVSAPAFTADPPIAVAPSTYNRSEASSDTRVAYGQGMSEWCGNCHASIHNSATNSSNTALIHPAGNGAKLSTSAANDLNGSATGTTIAAIYNYYKKSGDLSGTVATSYTSLVPFEEGTNTIATLSSHAVIDGSQTGGPSSGSENVMCLSCHRAHASGWSSMTRWNNKAEFITIGGAYPGTDATGEAAYGQYNMGYTQAQYAAAMYDRSPTQFASDQRSLCNKCHAKD